MQRLLSRGHTRAKAGDSEVRQADQRNAEHESPREEAAAGTPKCNLLALFVGDIKTEEFLAEGCLPRRTFKHRKIQPGSDDQKTSDRDDRGFAQSCDDGAGRIARAKFQERVWDSLRDHPDRDKHGKRDSQNNQIEDCGRNPLPKAGIGKIRSIGHGGLASISGDPSVDGSRSA